MTSQNSTLEDRQNDALVTESPDTYNNMPMKTNYSVKNLGTKCRYASDTMTFSGEY